MNRTVCLVMTYIAALASSVGAAEKLYSGAAGGSWDAAENWTPAGVPTLADDVTIDKAVKSVASIAAKSLNITETGLLAVGGTGTSAPVQSLPRPSIAPTCRP